MRKKAGKSMLPYANAFVSVYDKRGLESFLKPLAEKGMRIVSTGGTARHLRQKGLAVTDIQAQTGFSEVFSGRVKSLHPFIYMPLLARAHIPSDQSVLKKEGLSPFDLVVCNFYPFEQKQNLEEETELMEWVDIGGPSLLRAAAKNFFSVTALCSPKDYPAAQNGADLPFRRLLAVKAFARLSRYDLQIADRLCQRAAKAEKSAAKKIPPPSASVSCSAASKNPLVFPAAEEAAAGFSLHKTLRYGENPGQKAFWLSKKNDDGLHKAQVLQGKKLSFNNLLDLQAAASLLRALSPAPSAVLVKHNNPCGMASGKNIAEAFVRAYESDPVSAFGCVAGFNKKVGRAAALALKPLFVECVIAPDFSKEADAVLRVKKNLRLLKWPEMLSFSPQNTKDIRGIDGGFLIQDKAPPPLKIKNWRMGKKPSKDIQKDLLFALKAAAHLQSNSIAIVKDQRSLGLGMGQVNRVDAVRSALERVRSFHPGQNHGLVLASDGFFPFPDSIELLSGSGVQWVIQPGGALRDKEVEKKAKELKINMIMTGVRLFKH